MRPPLDLERVVQHLEGDRRETMQMKIEWMAFITSKDGNVCDEGQASEPEGTDEPRVVLCVVGSDRLE